MKTNEIKSTKMNRKEYEKELERLYDRCSNIKEDLMRKKMKFIIMAYLSKCYRENFILTRYQLEILESIIEDEENKD